MSREALISPSLASQSPCDDAETLKHAEAAPRSVSAAGSLAEPVHKTDAADGGHATRPSEIKNEEEDEARRLLGDIESIQVGQTFVLPLLFHVISPPYLTHLPTICMIKLLYRSLSVCAPCWLTRKPGKHSRSLNAGVAATPRTTGGKGPSPSEPRPDGAFVARK